MAATQAAVVKHEEKKEDDGPSFKGKRLDLPDIEWGTLWPLLLIGLGAWIVVSAMRRNR
jgi:hypothetical protein